MNRIQSTKVVYILKNNDWRDELVGKREKEMTTIVGSGRRDKRVMMWHYIVTIICSWQQTAEHYDLYCRLYTTIDIYLLPEVAE